VAIMSPSRKLCRPPPQQPTATASSSLLPCQPCVHRHGHRSQPCNLVRMHRANSVNRTLHFVFCLLCRLFPGASVDARAIASVLLFVSVLVHVCYLTKSSSPYSVPLMRRLCRCCCER
jgi:hypothetical protein